MLKKLRVDNFKTLVNFEFGPSRVNLLVGENNSGKTNLCQALRFLSLSSLMPLAETALEATGEIFNIPNVYWDKETVEFECECEISEPTGDGLTYVYKLSLRVPRIPKLGQPTAEFEVDRESLVVSGGLFRSTSLIDNIGGVARILQEGSPSEPLSQKFIDATAPKNATMLSRIYDLAHNAHANLFKGYLSSWQYYDLEPCQLRSARAGAPSIILTPNGSNLSSVLFALKNFDERLYRQVIHAVRQIEPKLDAINFVGPTHELIYMNLADAAGHRFGLASTSNGTLRFLALAYIFLVGRVVSETAGQPARLIMIEEPENGIYVRHLRDLLELMEIAGPSSMQYVFTSHAPYFVNLFDKYLHGIHVLKSDGQSSRVTKPDASKLESVLNEFSLGDAHFQELLA